MTNVGSTDELKRKSYTLNYHKDIIKQAILDHESERLLGS